MTGSAPGVADIAQAVSANAAPYALTILPTYKCTAACKNCCFGSHPWVEGRIPKADILRYIREAARIPTMRLVCFSGGECFLLGDDLIEAVALATRYGLSTRCVTNGYWATNIVTAKTILGRLKAAGLGEINFSTGDNHLEFVPIENIFYGCFAACSLNVGLAVMIEVTASRRVTKQTILGHALYRQLFNGTDLLARVIVESPWVPMDGEGPEVTYDESELINASNVSQRTGCDSVLTTLVATPQRRLKACCGITSEQIPELFLGSLDERPMADMAADMMQDFLKLWIAVDGPEQILAWAGRYDPTIQWENRFAHKCHACLFMYQDEKVRAVIRDHYNDAITDVLFRRALASHPN